MCETESNMTAPKVSITNSSNSKAVRNRRSKAKRNVMPQDWHGQRAQIQERQKYRFHPTGWPQAGQQSSGGRFAVFGVIKMD